MDSQPDDVGGQMYISEEIMNKVEEIEKEAAKFKRCLDVQICPTCGSHLIRTINKNEDLPDEVFECTSIRCDFSHIRPCAQ